MHFWKYSTSLDDIKIKVITMVLTLVKSAVIGFTTTNNDNYRLNKYNRSKNKITFP